MKQERLIHIGFGLVAALALPIVAMSQPGPTATRNRLLQEFQNPSNVARPRVWWHWMNGNVSIDGIKKDLLWMHKSGIGGFYNFDAGLSTPRSCLPG